MRRHTVILNPAQIEAFNEQGFLALEAVSTSEEIALLRMVLDRLLMTRAGYNEGAQFDLLRGDEGATENNLLQIMNPVNYAPELRDTLFRANALAIARQLLGEPATPFL